MVTGHFTMAMAHRLIKVVKMVVTLFEDTSVPFRSPAKDVFASKKFCRNFAQ